MAYKLDFGNMLGDLSSPNRDDLSKKLADALSQSGQTILPQPENNNPSVANILNNFKMNSDASNDSQPSNQQIDQNESQLQKSILNLTPQDPNKFQEDPIRKSIQDLLKNTITQMPKQPEEFPNSGSIINGFNEGYNGTQKDGSQPKNDILGGIGGALTNALKYISTPEGLNIIAGLSKNPYQAKAFADKASELQKEKLAEKGNYLSTTQGRLKDMLDYLKEKPFAAQGNLVLDQSTGQYVENPESEKERTEKAKEQGLLLQERQSEGQANRKNALDVKKLEGQNQSNAADKKVIVDEKKANEKVNAKDAEKLKNALHDINSMRSLAKNVEDAADFGADPKAYEEFKSKVGLLAGAATGKFEGMRGATALKNLKSTLPEAVSISGMIPGGPSQLEIRKAKLKAFQDALDTGESEMRKAYSSSGDDSSSGEFIGPSNKKFQGLK